MTKIYSFIRKYWHIFTISIVFFLIVFAYFWQQSKRLTGAWQFIPAPAVWVIETDDMLATWQDFEKKSLGEWFIQTNYGNIISERIGFLETFCKNTKNCFFQKKPLTISGHLNLSQEMDILLSMPCEEKEKVNLEKELKKLLSLTKTNIFSRSFKGFSIQETLLDDHKIAWFWANDFLFFSFSPVILEDVIRRIDENENKPAIPNIKDLKKIKLAQNNTKIYFNTEQFENLAKYLTANNQNIFFDFFEKMPTGMIWQADKNFKVFTGKGIFDKRDSLNFDKIFEKQTAQRFNLGNFISEKTSIFWYFNFSNNQLFWKNYDKFYMSKSRNYENFKKYLLQECAFTWLEGDNAEKLGQIIYLRTNNPKEVIKYFQAGNSIGKFGKFTFGEIGISQFITQNFGAWLKGFSRAYFTQIEDCIIITNSLENIKKYIDDYTKKNTWASKYPDLEKQFKEKNTQFRLALNPLKLLPLITQNVLENWYNWLENHAALIGHTGWWVIESNTNDIETKFSLALELNFNKQKISNEKVPVAYNTLWKTNFTDLISTSLFAVKNHNTQEKEWLCQDVKNNLYLISNKGNILFKTNTGGTLRSNPIQIDIYDNQRLQYLFINTQAVNVYDRLGRSVAGFPYRLTTASSPLKNFSYLDINQNNKPHYVISTERGEVYILDEKRNFLPEWKPKKLNYRLGTPPQIAQTRKESYLVLGQENGLVQVFDKKGKGLKNFPIKMEGRITSEIFVENGTEEKNTYFTVVSELGEMEKYNLLGQKISDKPILKVSSKSKVMTCLSENQKSFVGAVIDYNLVVIYNSQGKKLFEKKFASNTSSFQVQFFDIDTRLKIIAITDKASSKTYLLDMQGNLLADAFPNNRPIIIQKENQKIIIYYVYQKSIGALELKGIQNLKF